MKNSRGVEYNGDHGLRGARSARGRFCAAVARARRMNAPPVGTGRTKNVKLSGVGSDVVERWLRKTRGLIIFEDPLVSALSPILVYILNHPLAFSPYVHSILQE